MEQIVQKSRRIEGRTVLFVDDDPNHREIYARRLARHGYRVRTVAGADAAIAAIREERPAVVVLDIAMPGRDGLSALQEMIAMEPDLPVIIHTAYPTFRDDFLAWTADAYVEKSSDIAPLLTALERALSGVAVA